MAWMSRNSRIRQHLVHPGRYSSTTGTESLWGGQQEGRTGAGDRNNRPAAGQRHHRGEVGLDVLRTVDINSTDESFGRDHTFADHQAAIAELQKLAYEGWIRQFPGNDLAGGNSVAAVA